MLLLKSRFVRQLGLGIVPGERVLNIGTITKRMNMERTEIALKER